MILFVDNDIFLKLAGCDLLHEFIDCLLLTQQQIRVAPNLPFSIKGQMNKSYHGEQSEKAKNILSEFIKNVQVTDELVVDGQHEFLNELLLIPKIDPGEALLFTHAYYNNLSKIATGDKNCLTALLKAENLIKLQQALRGRIYTFELAMLILIEKIGFDEVNKKVSNRCVDDMVLKMSFGNDRTQDHAMQCLSSFTKDFLDLLVEPQLILK